MKLRDRTTGQIYSLYEIQKKFSNVSFPIVWDSNTFNFANVDLVVQVPQPAETCGTVVEYVGTEFVDGQWRDAWQVKPKYSDPTQQALCEAECLEGQWGTIRGERDRLITMTDYTQLPDTPITSASKSAFTTYRQQLRDITSQPDPYNIIWPILPIYEKH